MAANSRAVVGFNRLTIAALWPFAALVGACTSVNVTDSSLSGTWRVTAVNGQGTPADGAYHMQFADRRVSARFGCNSISGAYIVENNELRIDGLTSTLMSCPEPSATMERNASAVLNAKMKITKLGKRAARLDAEDGSIEIQR